MISDKLERRTFLKYCTATAIGGSLMINPLNLFANETSKRKRDKFKLSKPRWIIYKNGSYDLISEEIILKNCRPSIDGQSVMPKNVFLGDSPKGKRIVYELLGGFLMLDLRTNKDSISIGAEFSGFSKAPRWFFPISQAEVLGVNHFFKQGFGSDGPSGVFTLRNKNENSVPPSWSHDSFMTFGFLGKNETIAIGNLDQKEFHQRFTIYNRPHSGGINNRHKSEEKVFFESGMLLDNIAIHNEYIKLPELYFFTGNRPMETFQELAWRTSDITEARRNLSSSYHWKSSTQVKAAKCLENLKVQIKHAKQNKLALHTFCLNNYCIEGDWLEPHKTWTGGLNSAARTIYKDGFRAGIALSPFRVSEKSKLFKNHEDWLIHDTHNTIIVEDTVDGEQFFALDITHPGVQKYIAKIFRSLYKMGFIFYETEHMAYGFKDSSQVKRKVEGKSSVQSFREICSIIRTEIGPGSIWMMTETPYLPVIGFADIVGISKGQHKKWNGEKLQNFVRESWFSHYLNNIYWQNSPGEISLSEENGLTQTEKRSITLWTAMLGGAIGTTDNITNWNNTQLHEFRMLEPSAKQNNAYLPYWPDEDRIKVAVRHYRDRRAWGLLLFNDKNHSIEQTFEIFDLIEKDKAYVFTWNKDKLPFGEQIQIKVALEAHESKLFYLCENNEAPHPELTLGGVITKPQVQL